MVTVLAVLQRQVHAVLTALVAAVCLLLVPGRAGRLRSRSWPRGVKGGKIFDSLARQAGRQKLPVCACTLRRALDGRLPTRYTVLAFARGAGADKKKAEQMRAAAARASRPLPSRARSYVPGRISTRAGLARAPDKLKTGAQMSLRDWPPRPPTRACSPAAPRTLP
ncbi:hypothetical protein [Streptomyces sp. NPDC004528]|uniref:hypothetical protein n=1 Tax=Streptomyces sp. NPDC004528 TaxID=3154550 RepID=UPI0033A4D4B7